MPPEGEAAPGSEGQDTPITDAPDTSQETQGTEEFDHSDIPQAEDTDWRSRYEHLQPTYTRTSQEKAELERALEGAGLNSDWLQALNDPQTREHALGWLLSAYGYADGEEDPEQGYYDEEGEYEEEDPQFQDPRLDQFIQYQQQQEAEGILLDLQDHIAELAGDKGLDLSDRQVRAITREALEAGADPEKTEQIFSDWAKDLERYGEARIEQVREGKRGAPSPPASGSSGSPEIDPNDDKQRRERALQIANEVFESS